MTVAGLIAYGFLGLVGVGIILLGLNIRKDAQNFVGVPQDNYWASFLWPLLIVGGFAGALLTTAIAGLVHLVLGVEAVCVVLCE